LLAREVVSEMGGRVRFVVEDFGASPLAARFGIDKYPAVFVDQALVARPEDFYAWGGPPVGKYVPWQEVENRREFQRDLRRLLELRLAGAQVPSTATPAQPGGPRLLPDVTLTDLAGRPFTLRELRGVPVVVEFWATWCPPCLSTLSWLKELPAGSAQVVALAVESERAEVERLVAEHGIPGRVAMATPADLAAFGGLAAIPTLLVADAGGRVVRAFYGAPPDLHAQVERELARLR
jgi:thiol-disulfide isomerase/thioredoxin